MFGHILIVRRSSISPNSNITFEIVIVAIAVERLSAIGLSGSASSSKSNKNHLMIFNVILFVIVMMTTTFSSNGIFL